MNKFVIGIDPDAKKYGVAVYIDGELKALHSFDVVEMVDFIKGTRAYPEAVTFSMEDVQANKFIYRQKTTGKNLAVANTIAQSVGKCKQAQDVAQKFIEHYGYELQLRKPQKGNWAKNKDLFEKATGWKGRSNEDTRSAAFFGFLALDSIPDIHAGRP